MRALACIASVVGGGSWIASVFATGDVSDYLDWAGIGLLSLAALLVGTRLTGSLLPLRLVVAVGCVALAWSVVAVLRSEVDLDLVNAGLGGLAVLLGLVYVVRRPAHVSAGTHAR